MEYKYRYKVVVYSDACQFRSSTTVKSRINLRGILRE